MLCLKLAPGGVVQALGWVLILGGKRYLLTPPQSYGGALWEGQGPRMAMLSLEGV